MTDPIPSWVTAVPPNPAVHNVPPPPVEWQQMAEEQRQALWNKLLESVWQQFMLWVEGVLLPGAAGPQITAWWNAMLGFVGDIIEVMTGVEDGDPNDLGSWFNSVFGAPGSTSIPSSIATLQAAIHRLEQAGNPGQSIILDFSTYPDSTNLPSNFTQTYTGSVDNPFGVNAGRARIGPGAFGARGTYALYNGFVTDTDTQVVTGYWNTGPVHDGIGNRAYFSLEGRCDSADTTKVYAEFAADSVELGCYVSGVKTVFATIGNGGFGFFFFKPGAAYNLYLGTPSPGGPDRAFLLTEDARVIIDVTDSLAVSQMGASYRGGGIAARWPTSLGNIKPGELVAWGFADN